MCFQNWWHAIVLFDAHCNLLCVVHRSQFTNAMNWVSIFRLLSACYLLLWNIFSFAMWNEYSIHFHSLLLNNIYTVPYSSQWKKSDKRTAHMQTEAERKRGAERAMLYYECFDLLMKCLFMVALYYYSYAQLIKRVKMIIL